MNYLTYGSVCSGIEAASVAWHPLGWRASWLAEIEKFPSAVLAHHYPEVPNLGDMTVIADMVRAGDVEAPDILVGGTPCQAFSVAGARAGLADPRGQLTLSYVDLANAIDSARAFLGKQPAVILWENVPGVLSSKDNAFGCFLGALAGESCELQPPGGKWKDAGCVFGPERAIAWRILDAQYIGLAQRRRRVFVVASARNGFDPTQVLFEFESVRRDTPPSREAGKNITHPTAPCLTSSGRGVERAGDTRGQDPVVAVQLVVDMLQENGKAAGSCTQQDAESDMLVVHGTQDPCVSDIAFALGRNSGQENAIYCREIAQTITSNYGKQVDNTDSALGPNVVAFTCKDYGADAGPVSPTLRAMNHAGSHANAGGQVAVCITGNITHTLKAEGFDGSEDGTGRGQPIVSVLRGISDYGDGMPCLRAKGGDAAGGSEALIVPESCAVRRLTPRECERLQGFPDDYTMIARGKKAAEDCPDGPRYKALGNSMAVPCMAWIGRRIAEELSKP